MNLDDKRDEIEIALEDFSGAIISLLHSVDRQKSAHERDQELSKTAGVLSAAGGVALGAFVAGPVGMVSAMVGLLSGGGLMRKGYEHELHEGEDSYYIHYSSCEMLQRG